MAFPSGQCQDGRMEDASSKVQRAHEYQSNSIVLEFAQTAAQSGWTDRALNQFCLSRSISLDERQKRWPHGVRSIAWEFNQFADSVMAERICHDRQTDLTKILIQRFRDNEQFKQSVCRLARSDLFHPIGTLRRTLQTARLILGKQDGTVTSLLRVWWLALLYSFCVLLWLVERPPYSRLRKAVRVTARLVGDR